MSELPSLNLTDIEVPPVPSEVMSLIDEIDDTHARNTAVAFIVAAQFIQTTMHDNAKREKHLQGAIESMMMAIRSVNVKYQPLLFNMMDAARCWLGRDPQAGKTLH